MKKYRVYVRDLVRDGETFRVLDVAWAESRKDAITLAVGKNDVELWYVAEKTSIYTQRSKPHRELCAVKLKTKETNDTDIDPTETREQTA